MPKKIGSSKPESAFNFSMLVVLVAFALAAPQWAAGQARAQINVDAQKVEGRISPMLYGHFMEHMYEDVKFGLYAELIRDRSFEDAPNAIGLPRFWERDPDDRDDDSPLKFHWDDSVFYPQARSFDSQSIDHSLRITLSEKSDARRGIHQGGIPVRAGVEYHGYFWLKSEGFDGHIKAALEQDQSGGETYDSQDLPVTSSDWRKYEYTLRSRKSDPLGKLALLVFGKGRLWIDQVSLMPGDAVDGVRADVFEKVKALRPAFMRWPGGNVAQDYHWMWGIGPRDERTTWVNLSWSNEMEPSDFGTDEYIQYCRNLGAVPTLVVNVEGRGGTAEEAAAWVEYANGPASSKYGAMRAKNGHSEPYGVKYWEVGNEVYGDWVRGHSDAETYGRNFNRYQAAMKAVDPGIKLIAVGDNNLDWDRTVLKIAGQNINYLALHHYYSIEEMHGDELNLMAHPLAYEKFYQSLRQMIRDTGREIKVDVNEWNTFLPMPRVETMEPAVYGARLMNVFERNSDLVTLSSVSDLVNGWPGGVIQASRHGIFVTPVYLAIEMYNSHLGSDRLAIRVDGPTFDSSLEGKGVASLDAVSSRAPDGKHIFLKVVNTELVKPIRTAIHLAGVKVASGAEIETLAGDSLAAANTFANPHAVSVKREHVDGGPNFEVELPAHSVSVITFTAEP